MHGTGRNETSIKKGRSRITNNRALFPRKLDGNSIDERGAWSRRLRDVIAALASDAGGADRISEAQRVLIRKAATMIVATEHLEATFALDGEASATNLETYSRLSSSIRRMLMTLGIKRQAHDVTPSLHEYLRSKATGRATLEHSD
jgi:hypothetical protein